LGAGDHPDTLAFAAEECNPVIICLWRGRDAEISAGVMAASVPSAGMILHQTDFAFLPV
jgi:hypothetical protein